MRSYLARRLIVSGIALVGLSVLVFVFLRIVPGDAAVLALGEEGAATEQDIQAFRDRYHLNDPVHEQYLRWVGGLLTGDLGTSFLTGRSVSDEISIRMSTTLELGILALAVSALAGLTGGTIAAARRGTPLDHLVRVFSVFWLAVPSFWVGTMVLIFGATWLNWVPPVGHSEPWEDPWRNLQQFFVPALLLGANLAAALSRLTRSALLDILEEDYVRTARAKGLGTGTVYLRHALRNSLIPVITLLATQLGAVLSGAIVIENVFSLPGLGRLITNSMLQRDYPVIQGVILLMGVAIIAMNLVVDLLYGLIDPRIRVTR